MYEKLVAAAVIALCGSVSAAGVYDGIYIYTGAATAYYSVHQNGNQLIVVGLGSVPANGIGFALAGGYTVRPPTVEHWSYSMGTIFGNTARITGTGPFGSCTTTSDVVIDGARNAFVTFVSTAQTTLANQQNINCVAVLQSAISVVGPTLTMRKIF